MPELWDIYDENKNKTGRTAISSFNKFWSIE